MALLMEHSRTREKKKRRAKVIGTREEEKKGKSENKL